MKSEQIKNLDLALNAATAKMRANLYDTAVGFLFQKLTETEPEITAIPLDPPITAHICLVWKKQKYPFSAMKSLKSFLHHTDLFA